MLKLVFQTSRLLQVQHHPVRFRRSLRDRKLRVREQRRRDRLGRVQDWCEGRQQNVSRVRPRHHDLRPHKGPVRGREHAAFHSTHGHFGAKEFGEIVIMFCLYFKSILVEC